MQRVLISALAFDGGKSGIANYIENVVTSLSHHLLIDLVVNEDEKHFFEHLDNITFIIVSRRFQKPLFNMLWHMFVLPFKVQKSRYLWMFLPAGNRRLMLFYPIKTLVTMHDLSQFHVDDKYDAFRMFYIKKVIPFFLKKADLIFTVSANTADDVAHFYEMDRDQLIVNYNGVVTDSFYPLEQESKEQSPRQKSYILYVARLEHPGKNHLNLIKAYELLSPQLKATYDLCLIGGDWNGAEVVHQYAEQSTDTQNIIFAGFVANEDLPAYYRHASLFAFPSFYEGFGIPVVEAMASGTAVVCSNTSSLPEVGGDAALYFDPKSPQEIADAITTALSSESKRYEMIERGYKHIKQFNWDLHAQKLIDSAK